MAQPLQYQSQFVPTDFNTVGNILGMFRQDMGQRNQEFDQAQMMQNKALAELYGTKTYDQDVINEQANRLKQQIEDVVKKRGMDYGAASGEIASLIAQEQSNPIWGLNTQKVKQAELLEQALARNPNLKVLKDPRNLALSKDMKSEDIGYSVLDPKDIQATIEDVYGNLGKQLREGNLKGAGVPGLLQATTTRGLTGDEVAQMLQNPQTRDAILAKMPQLKSYIADPEMAAWFDTQIGEGLKGLVGGEQKQFIQDPSFERPSRSGKDKPSDMPRLNIFQTPEVNYTTEKTKENISLLRRGLESGKFNPKSIPTEEKMFDPFVEGVVFDFMNEMQYLGEAGVNLSLNILNMEDKEKAHSKYWEQSPEGFRQKRMINKYEVLVDAYKDKYSNLYKSSKNDEEFLNKVEEMEISNSVIKGSELSLADPSIAKNVFVSVKEIKDGRKSASTFVNKKTGKGISRKEAEDRLGTSPLQVRVNGEGVMTVAIPDKKGNLYEDYIINPEALPTQLSTPTDNRSLKEINDIFTRYNLSDEEITSINNSVYQFQGSPYYYQVNIDPINPKNKTLTKIIGKNPDGSFVYDDATLSELQYINAVNKFQNIKPSE